MVYDQATKGQVSNSSLELVFCFLASLCPTVSNMSGVWITPVSVPFMLIVMLLLTVHAPSENYAYLEEARIVARFPESEFILILLTCFQSDLIYIVYPVFLSHWAGVEAPIIL